MFIKNQFYIGLIRLLLLYIWAGRRVAAHGGRHAFSRVYRGCLFVDPRTRHDHETVETKKWYEQRPALQARIGSYRIV